MAEAWETAEEDKLLASIESLQKGLKIYTAILQIVDMLLPTIKMLPGVNATKVQTAIQAAVTSHERTMKELDNAREAALGN
jgi:hypothetical protein